VPSGEVAREFALNNDDAERLGQVKKKKAHYSVGFEIFIANTSEYPIKW
jgi:hypothetical protein